MANNHPKRCLMSLAFGEMQIKSTMNYHHTSIKIPKTKVVIILNTSEDVEKLSVSYIAGEYVKWYSHHGK